MTVTLNKWYAVEEDDGFVTLHYVGGEQGWIMDDWYDTKEEADAAVKRLNAEGGTYTHDISELV